MTQSRPSPTCMVPFEEENIEAYRLLLRIEIAVREVLREALLEFHGARWQRQLPKNLLQKVLEGQNDEEKKKRFDFLKLGPLYYLTLGELLPILQMNIPAVKKAVDSLGGEGFVRQLDLSFGPRNAVAHNRAVSSSGLALIKAIYLQMESALTVEGLLKIVSNPECGVRCSEATPRLVKWLNDSLDGIKQLRPDIPVDPSYHQAATQFWWGMADACPFDCEAIDAVAAMLDAYAKLPNGVGSAALRHRFLHERDALGVLTVALDSLRVPA